MSESAFVLTGNKYGRTKRRSPTAFETETPRKKARSLLLEDEDSTSSSDDTVGGALLHSEAPTNVLTINQEFAKRFEYNKRREELNKLEDRYGKSKANRRGEFDDSESEGDTGSSTDSEEEDDNGVLALGNLDQQVQATLDAIRAKDPRVYDKNTSFYTDPADQGDQQSAVERTHKPLYLSDYHRQNIMQGAADIDENEGLPTYAQEQDTLKATILREMHAGADADDGSNGHSDNEQKDDFLVPKVSKKRGPDGPPHVATAQNLLDVNDADNDPEKFLSEFMSARAWIPHAGSRFVPFESDDEEEEIRADKFEEAYNLRFEDPSVLNEKLVSHARDAAARYSVRREEVTGRKKTRETERAKREAEKQEREEEKARLRKLRIAAAEEKVKKIKDAAGLRRDNLNIKDWSNFLEEGWDTDRWNEELHRRFGDAYYEDQDIENDSTVGDSRGKVKKPKWKDDIAIDDLIPDFTEHDQSTKHRFTLSDLESDKIDLSEFQSDLSESKRTTPHLDKKRKPGEEIDSRKQARDERRQIEQLIDKTSIVDNKLASMGAKHAGTFRYRETSPINYGLTAQDILMASDSQLNQYAGLKKLASFRDSTKKNKDHKRLGKKARLRQWRKETFGSEHGSQKTLADVLAGHGDGGSIPTLAKGSNVVDRSRRKRHGKGKVHVKSP